MMLKLIISDLKVARRKSTDVSAEHIASNFRFEEAKQETKTKQVSSRAWLNFNGLHAVISHKIELFVTSGVRTSDPTWVYNSFASEK
jgi:microsomal dipeptidase-like Zn-dependent dipeptidase